MNLNVGNVFLLSWCHQDVVRYQTGSPVTLNNVEVISKGLFSLFRLVRTRKGNVNESIDWMHFRIIQTLKLWRSTKGCGINTGHLIANWKSCKMAWKNQFILLQNSGELCQCLVSSHLVLRQEIQPSGMGQQRKDENHPKEPWRMLAGLNHGKLSSPIAVLLIWFSLAMIHSFNCVNFLILFSI